MYSVMELKYLRALWMSLEPLSRSRALFRMTLSLNEALTVSSKEICKGESKVNESTIVLSY